jgi:hypothetical protein
MTDDALRPALAVKELAKQLRNAVMSAPPDIDAAEAMEIPLRQFLANTEQRVWKEAAQELMDRITSAAVSHTNSVDIMDFIRHCRAKAGQP